MAKAPDVEEAKTYRYLADTPPQGPSEDYFGHRAQAAAVADAIVAAPAPFTIAVFGEWGVGKTTITRDLLGPALKERGKLLKRKYGLVYFDAWKYSGDSLRRQFLRVFADELDKLHHKPLSKPLADQLENLDQDVQRPLPVALVFSWRRALFALLAFLLILIVLFGLLGTSGLGEKLFLAAGGAVAAWLLTQFGQIVYIPDVRVTLKRLDSPEQFESAFALLLRAAPVDEIVVVIDNLDRCPTDRVLDMLSTIATFLESTSGRRQPVFVIPCDQKAIVRHVSKQFGDADAREYLHKLFHAHIDVAPLLDEDIRTFAQTVLTSARLLDGLDDAQRALLVDVVRFGFRNNPRSVKQFVNTLVSKLLVVRERASHSMLPDDFPINVPGIAKLAVIEEQWPELFAVLSARPGSLDELGTKARYPSTALGEPLDEFGRDPSLMLFLRSTRLVSVERVELLIYGKASASSRDLSSYGVLRTALINGDMEQVQTLLSAATPEQLGAYAEAAKTVIDGEIKAGSFSGALNTIEAAGAFPDWPGRADQLSNSLLSRLFSVDGLQSRMAGLSPRTLDGLLRDADNTNREAALEEYSRLLAEGSQEEVPSALVVELSGILPRYGGHLSTQATGYLRSAILGRVGADGPAVRGLVEAVPNLARDPQVIEHVISSLPKDLDQDPPANDWSTVWRLVIQYTNSAHSSQFIQVATQMAQAAIATSLPVQVDHVMRLLAGSQRALQSGGNSTTADVLVSLLRSTSLAPTQKSVAMVAMATLLNVCGETERAASAAWLQEGAVLDPSVVTRAVRDEDFVPDVVSQSFTTAVLTGLAERIRRGTHDAVTYEAVYAVLGARWIDPAILGVVVDAFLGAGLYGQLAEVRSTNAFRGAEAGVRQQMAAKVWGSLDSAGLDQYGQIVDAASALDYALSSDDQRRLRTRVVAGMESPTEQEWRSAVRLLESPEFRRRLGPTELSECAQDLVSWLDGAFELAPQAQAAAEALIVIMNDVNIIVRERFVTMLRRQVAILSGDRRLTVARLLSDLPHDQGAGPEIVSQLLDLEGLEADLSIRAGLLTVARRIAGSDKRRAGWKRYQSHLLRLEQSENEADLQLAKQLKDS